MLHGQSIRTWVMAAGLAATLLPTGQARARNVTVALVTGREGRAASLEKTQALWKSPFGGWDVTAWPFTLRVGDQSILEYSTAAEKLLAGTGLEAGPDDEDLNEMLGEITGQKDVRPEDLATFRLDRQTSAALDLGTGRHVIHPFGIEFTVAGDGALATRDRRLRVDSKAGRVEVICHPVTVKTLAGTSSVSVPLSFTCAGAGLLGNLSSLIAEYESKVLGKPDSATRIGMRRATLYVPASAPGTAYEVNGVKFELDAEGRVKLAAGAKARCPDGREIHLQRPAAKPAAAPAATQPIGVSWFGARDEVTIAGKVVSAGGGAGTGSAWLPVPAKGRRTVKLGDRTVRLPAADPRWPHGLLVWDVAKAACWAVETAPLAAKPGARWSCRIKRVAGRARVPGSLKVRLDAVAAGAAGGGMALKAAGGGVFAGDLPAEPGLWRLRVAQVRGDSGGLLQGRTLGLALITDGAATPAVSLFTVRNRGVLRRGDSVDVLWSARLPAGGPAAEWPVVLRGVGLDARVGRIAVPRSAAAGAAGAASGALRLDTAALAPGAYELAVGDPGVACYPMRFHIVQKEMKSDFEVSSFYPVCGPSQPYPGSSVLSYKNHGVGGPGMAPFRPDADASLDGALAAYANAPAGPALENFARPTAEETDLMAVAAMGMRSMPSYPEGLSQEQYNPKHSLPEDLAHMRRRMALVVQPKADFPGLDGFGLGWHPKVWGFWEGQPRLDGHQGRRNALANKLGGIRFGEGMKKYNADKLPEVQKKELGRWVGARAWGAILPLAFEEWFADAYQMRPGLTLHNTKPTGWGQGGVDYPPATYAGLSHRDALDYSDYCIQAWQNFIIPPIMGMGNQAKQKLSIAFHSHGGMRAEEIPLAFGAAGRGLDGFSLSASDNAQSENLLSVFSRFGSWMTALDPLPDVAVYFNDDGGIRMVLHDLARLRRPGMVVSPEDVLAGELSKYKVLMLLGVKAFELAEIKKAVRDFEAKGGVIIKDDACHESMPGRKLGFVYAKTNHGAWHLSSNGEWPFAVMWDGFKGSREKPLSEAFARTPPIPVTTPDATVIISPLAGKESILSFVINQTLVPTVLQGRWRQYVVLPKIGELFVDKGWHVHDVLAGKAATVKSTRQGQRVALDFTRLEGALYLLTKREPKSMAIKTERTAPDTLRLTGWLAGAGQKPLADPMPFEVTLKGPDGATLFHKFAALGPDVALDVPVPAMSGDARLELVARDLVLGTTATQAVAPAEPAVVVARATPDLIGGPAKIKAFLAERKGPVTVILDEEQDAFRPAAERVAALLKKSGRDARVVRWDLADIRPLYLRWNPRKEDLEAMEGLKDGNAFVWRVGLKPWAVEEHGFEHPIVGWDELGPRLRHDADVVLIGAPANHRALAQLEPYLRRVLSDSYPAPGGFFVHYLFSPFQGGYDGLYLGCHDAAGAEAAVACLATVKAPAPARDAKRGVKPVVTRGGAQGPLESMVEGKFGVYVLDAAFTPSGKKMFLTTNSYGDWFFVFNQSGEIVEQRTPPNTPGFPNWYQWGRGGLRPVSETALRIGLWKGECLYDLKRGYLGRSAGDPPHMLPNPGNGGGPVVKGPTHLEDRKTGATYLGGYDSVTALDREWRLLWRFDDGEACADLAYPRATFPRAVSGNGRVLLVAAFGVHQMLYATAETNPAIMGVDTATGKLLWQRTKTMLNEGKVVALDDRFIVVDDEGDSHEIIAADGRKGSAMSALTGSADWVLQLPGRNAILIVENSHFDRQERTARVYIRRIDGGGERELPVPGRVTAVTLAPDNRSFTVATTHGRTLRFALDGTLQWEADTPAAILVRYWPDGRTVVVGTHDGVVHFLNAADGRTVRRVDLNHTNVTTGDSFVKQELMGEIPQDAARTVPPPPPEPSYLTRFDADKVAFGPNLAPPERMRALLKPARKAASDPAKPGYVGKLTRPVKLTFKVEAGTTYLVEMLNAVADPAGYTPLVRLEVAVTGKGLQGSKNLPFTACLPLGTSLARRRTAFRADAAGEVTLTLRAVLPRTIGEGRRARTTYDKASETPVLLGDVVVSAIRFPGRNLLFDGGPASRSKPAGTLTCTAFPWQNGTNTPKTPYTNAAAGLRLVNGVIANEEAAWAGAGGVEKTEVVVHFKSARKLSALVIYEDASGPVPSGDRVRERTTMRYGVDIHNANNGRWSRLGHVANNTQTINIFACPSFEVDRIRCVWSGHHDYLRAARTDGAVRTAQIEAYVSGDALDLDMDDLLEDDGLNLEP